MVNCLDGTYRQPNPLNYGWTLDDGVLQPLRYTGATLPNDEEISQLTEGGKLEEQQEPELTTPEIPQELIGYEWISDSDGEDYPWRIKQMNFWWGQLSSGVARAFSSGWLAHPENRNEEENK